MFCPKCRHHVAYIEATTESGNWGYIIHCDDCLSDMSLPAYLAAIVSLNGYKTVVDGNRVVQILNQLPVITISIDACADPITLDIKADSRRLHDVTEIIYPKLNSLFDIFRVRVIIEGYDSWGRDLTCPLCSGKNYSTGGSYMTCTCGNFMITPELMVLWSLHNIGLTTENPQVFVNGASTQFVGHPATFNIQLSHRGVQYAVIISGELNVEKLTEPLKAALPENFKIVIAGSIH